MGRICDEHGVKKKQIMPSAMKLLSDYQWPGNVRELRNFIEKVIVLVDRDEIYPKDIYPILGKFACSEGFVLRSLKLKEARLEFEKKFICNRLDECNWNMTKASEKLGIPRTYLHKKLKKLGIEVENGP
jgi:two-component system nitrogen regulation response regulator NtrX